jgi:protein required for attachment to host cells
MIQIKAPAAPLGHRHGPRSFASEIAVKKTITWVVVADHQHGHAYQNDGPNRGLQPVDGFSFDTHLHPDREIVSDRPARVFSGAGGTPHAVEPKTDPHREEGERFVARMSAALASAYDRGAFQRLLLIAPPRALGEFRTHLAGKVREKIVAEIDRDLTRAPLDQIVTYVAPHLAV